MSPIFLLFYFYTISPQSIQKHSMIDKSIAIDGSPTPVYVDDIKVFVVVQNFQGIVLFVYQLHAVSAGVLCTVVHQLCVSSLVQPNGGRPFNSLTIQIYQPNTTLIIIIILSRTP